MIKSFADKDTESIFNRTFVKGIPQNVQKIGLRKLIMMNAATSENDLRVPPGNHFEHLEGNRLGQVSIRVNEQFRICFRFIDHDCYDVGITDYH